jgi:DNA primase
MVKFKITDFSKLENIKKTQNGSTARCPACTEQGRDSKGAHLFIYNNGNFGCVANPDDNNHRLEILKILGQQVEKVSEEPESKTNYPKTYSKDLLLKLFPNYEYWNNRGISTEILKKFGGGLCYSGQFLRRYTIPIYDNVDNIVGWTGRLVVEPWNENCFKWKHAGRKSQWVFPLHLSKKAILEKREIILVESVGDVYSLFECGIENCLCLFGIKISPILIQKLISLVPKYIILSLNNDEKSQIGNIATIEIRNKLIKFFDKPQILIKLPKYKDLNEQLIKEGKESIIKLYE